MTKISCMLFDLGGVLVNWHNSWLIEEISNRFDLPKNQLFKEFEKNLHDLSSGNISENVFWHQIGDEINSSQLRCLEISLFDEIFRKFAKINNEVYSLTKKLKLQGMSLGILSNTEPVTYSIVEELTSLDHFDFKFLSYTIRHLKPDRKIFEYVLNNVPFKSEELLFIDDSKSNVDSAKQIGIDSIQFSSIQNLIEELQTRKILNS